MERDLVSPWDTGHAPRPSRRSDDIDEERTRSVELHGGASLDGLQMTRIDSVRVGDTVESAGDHARGNDTYASGGGLEANNRASSDHREGVIKSQ